MLARDANFTTLGGGIKISTGGCSTTATATKDLKEFLITAGHCLTSIGSTVNQYTTSVGTQHLSVFSGNYDIGLILLTDTTRSITNKFYYNPCSNCEYDSTHSGLGPSIVGALVCKSGASSEVTCGTIEKIDASVTVGGVPLTNTVKFTKASLPYLGIGGDSGSIVFTAYNYGIIGPYSGGVNDSTGSSVAYTTKLVNFLADYGVTLYTSNTNKPVNPNK
ncbi:hypothetical protein J4772_10775 [Cohnella sp. LGH]|uniref:hypothetical protein n=1 Tax=Cohnella sp. LGH TaxID=1619153 RepID=UPI001ADA040B|nr:hypothetical protein [Cohnella sp. LGH]QTH44833.1 hypothetical protein J4772_10775 [Cohnella sp. LGH]